MAQIRLSKLIKQYNIGLGTLVDFLVQKGYPIEFNPNWKVDASVLPLLEERFGRDVALKEAAKKVEVRLSDILDMPSKIKIKKPGNSKPGLTGELLAMTVEYIDGRGRVFAKNVKSGIKGILFPKYITYREERIPQDIAARLIKDNLKEGRHYLFTVISHDVEGGTVQLSFDFSQKEFNLQQPKSLAEGQSYRALIVDSTPNYHIVRIPSHSLLGIVPKEQINEGDIASDGSITLEFRDTFVNPFRLHTFTKPVALSNSLHSEDRAQTPDSFLAPSELEVISPENFELIRIFLEKHTDMTRQLVDTLPGAELYCRVPDDSPLTVHLQMHPDSFQGKVFWLVLREKNGPELFLFNEEKPALTLIVKPLDEKEFFISGFDSEDRAESRRVITYNNRNACLKISSKQLHFLSRYGNIPMEYSATETLDYIRQSQDINKNLLPELKESIRKRTMESARDYTTLREYLKYQKEKELGSSLSVVHVPPERIHYSTNTFSSSPMLRLDLTPDELDSLLDENSIESEERIHVSILEGDKELAVGVLECEVDSVHLGFEYSNVNTTRFKSLGINLSRRASVKHLDVQINALSSFVRGSDTYQDLLNRRLETPDISPYENMSFNNPCFNTDTLEGNNQTVAVRKALGNKNIVLIQGPPGTGKTTIIVEIIEQLAAQGKRVLVCSQAHAAVKNIYDRLDHSKLNILRLDDQDGKKIQLKTINTDNFTTFLQNNAKVVSLLASGETGREAFSSLIDSFDYPDDEAGRNYRSSHWHLYEYRENLEGADLKKLEESILRQAAESEDFSRDMTLAQLYREKDVIMGTCIGVGMDHIIRKYNIGKFDTVIIDEAAKANLAETLVPMNLGERFVLVGDHRQLPPFIDREDIREFTLSQSLDEEEDKGEGDFREVVKSLSNSMFADFWEHPNFPEENKVSLNYQFRMCPEIGNYISELFYSGALHSAPGTARQKAQVEGFPDAVTFVDTTTKVYSADKDPSEREGIDGSVFNPREIADIKEFVLPRLEKALEEDPSLKVGIITAYKAQYHRLSAALSGTSFHTCVHTIDSIQGSEFDIVVFSFVRSFNRSAGKTVGFLDDLRRLNVSLSRAKKKLILVGNLHTLQNERAHTRFSMGDVTPLEVFRKISRNVTRFSEGDPIEKFRKTAPFPGQVFEGCSWEPTKSPRTLLVRIPIGDWVFLRNIPAPRFQMPADGEPIELVYTGDDNAGRPLFSIDCFRRFKSAHPVGESLPCTVVDIPNLQNDTESEITVFCEDIRGKLHNSSSFLRHIDFHIGDTLNLSIRSFDDITHSISFQMDETPAQYIQRKKGLAFFKATVLKDDRPPLLWLQFGKDSIAVESYPLWFSVLPNKEYDLVKLPRGFYTIHKHYFEEFHTKHPEGETLLGIPFFASREKYFIDIDGVVCQLDRNLLMGRKLIFGKQYRLRIALYDTIKHIIELETA